jgi:hypothetical protein
MKNYSKLLTNKTKDFYKSAELFAYFFLQIVRTICPLFKFSSSEHKTGLKMKFCSFYEQYRQLFSVLTFLNFLAGCP